MRKEAKILVTGHRGLVGSAVVRRLQQEGYARIVTRTHEELDLTRQAEVEEFFGAERPEYVFHCAARVGGILANDTQPGDFMRDNLLIAALVIDAASRYGVRKFEFLGSSCIYPRAAPQPLREESLLTSALEPTNQWYAVAKIAGIKLAQGLRRQHGFKAISLMPTNLYGPGDNFDLRTSHVLPALVRKFHEAKVSGAASVTVWGTGTPRREFLHVDDLADACVFLMLKYDSEEIINVGTGEDLTIAELAGLVKEVTGYGGEIVYDGSRPDGPPRKLLEVSRLRGLGWRPAIGLREGVSRTYRWYVDHAGER